MADKKLAGIKWPNMPNDTYWLDAEKVIYDETETYPDGSTGKALQNKAEIDGYYSDMTVGDAEQLVSTVFTEDSTPYNFRTSGGSVDIGDREYVNGIVGGTVAWNQLAYANYDYTLDGDNNRTVSVFTHGVPSIIGHKYLVSATITADTTVGGVAFQYGFTQTLGKGVGFKAVIYQATSVASYCYTYIGSTEASGTSLSFKGFNIFDLTQLFGSTIADYIYSLEQANAGAGVAWFRKLFPKPYYAYNAGELMSVKALRHITRGFNAWDEEWEVGKINTSTGANQSGSDRIRSKNYIHVLPSTAYYFKAPNSLYFCWYDADKNFIGTTPSDGRNATKTTPSDAFYLRFMVDPAYGTTYKNDICINLHWDGERDGEYEEYVEHVYELDPDLELRGIPKLTAGNDLYYDGDVYEPDGTVTRKYGIVDLGTLTWEYDTTGTYPVFFSANLASLIKTPSTANMDIVCISSKYPTIWYTNAARSVLRENMDDKLMSITNSGSVGRIVIRDDSYSSLEAFTTAMSGVYLVYELATPTTETADPYNGTQIVDDFGTEEFVDTRDVAIPVGHITRYVPNLRAKLEMAPDSPDSDGDYLMRHSNGENSYVSLASSSTIQDIISRLEALEGGGE